MPVLLIVLLAYESTDEHIFSTKLVGLTHVGATATTATRVHWQQLFIFKVSSKNHQKQKEKHCLQVTVPGRQRRGPRWCSLKSKNLSRENHHETVDQVGRVLQGHSFLLYIVVCKSCIYCTLFCHFAVVLVIINLTLKQSGHRNENFLHGCNLPFCMWSFPSPQWPALVRKMAKQFLYLLGS